MTELGLPRAIALCKEGGSQREKLVHVQSAWRRAVRQMPGTPQKNLPHSIRSTAGS